MSIGAAAKRKRAPEELLERNRARIVAAVVDVVAKTGWSSLTFAAVGQAAGLSRRPVQDRFPDRWALAGAAWQLVAGPALRSALAEVLASAGLADGEPRPESEAVSELQFGPGLRKRLGDALAAAGLEQLAVVGDATAASGSLGDLRYAVRAALEAAARSDDELLRAEGPSADWLARAYEPFLRPGAPLRAATEFLVVSEFDEGLAAVVRADVGADVAAWCSASGADGRDAARRAYLISSALGLLLARTRSGVDGLDVTQEAALQMRALHANIEPAPLPDIRATHLDDFLRFDTGDTALDDLLRATLEEVGRVGFDGATTAGIGRASGRSEGLVFARYQSKVDMFVDATRRQHARGWRENEAFQQQLAQSYAKGIDEAVMIREMQRPHLSTSRAISLEQIRLALHDDRLREVQWGELDSMVTQSQSEDPNWHPGTSPARIHMSVAVGIGVTALPLLAPDAWQLPYDVVTVPFTEAAGA